MRSRNSRVWTVVFWFCLLGTGASQAGAQPWQGLDLSYVNQMEDCGAVYYEEGTARDPYELLAERGCQLVRLRLWHTPIWQDTLDNGFRYSDLADVKRSIARARSADMQVLLNFHLSDTWADPGKQVIPAAWAGLADNLPLLQDSLYEYIYGTLIELHQENLLPEIVQIGNETNKGILLSQVDNDAGWSLDWERNTALFQTAIAAVRDVEIATTTPIQIALHWAGPEATAYYVDTFVENGITDFDIIGISYYWQWHRPHTIADVATTLSDLREEYPEKEVIIMETGFPWTTQNQDAANNILQATPDGYPPTPSGQADWLSDLSEAVLDAGGAGVIYWEPAWVSTYCYTPWGHGSHYENAAFFDFEGELLSNATDWLSALNTKQETAVAQRANCMASVDRTGGHSYLRLKGQATGRQYRFRVWDTLGRMMYDSPAAAWIENATQLPVLPRGIYRIGVYEATQLKCTISFVY